MSTSPTPYNGPSRAAILTQIQAFNNYHESDPQNASLKIEYISTPADDFQLSIHKSDLVNQESSSISLQHLCQDIKEDLESLIACPTRQDVEKLDLQGIVRCCQALMQSIIKLQESAAVEREEKRPCDIATVKVSEEADMTEAVKDTDKEAAKAKLREERGRRRIKRVGDSEEGITPSKNTRETESENERMRKSKFLTIPDPVRRRSRSRSPRPDSNTSPTSSPHSSPRRTPSPMPSYLLDLKPKSKPPIQPPPPILKQPKKERREIKAITFTHCTKPGSNSSLKERTLPHGRGNTGVHVHRDLKLGKEEKGESGGSGKEREEWIGCYGEREEGRRRRRRNEIAAERAYEVGLANAREV